MLTACVPIRSSNCPVYHRILRRDSYALASVDTLALASGIRRRNWWRARSGATSGTGPGVPGTGTYGTCKNPCLLPGALLIVGGARYRAAVVLSAGSAMSLLRESVSALMSQVAAHDLSPASGCASAPPTPGRSSPSTSRTPTSASTCNGAKTSPHPRNEQRPVTLWKAKIHAPKADPPTPGVAYHAETDRRSFAAARAFLAEALALR